MLVDSDILIDYLRGRESVRRQLHDAFVSERLQTTVVNKFELLAGARRLEEQRAVEDLLDTLNIVPLDSFAALLAGKLHANLLASGVGIGMADTLIAGIALANNIPLLTRNRKHFERVQNLKLVEM